jgi:uncharacterized protein YidB (DUF937 family)
MGLMDVLNGMRNGPQGAPASGSGGGGMSPITMAVLGYLAYKGIKHLSGSNAPDPAGPTAASGGLGGLLNGGLGGLLGGGLGNMLANGSAGAALSNGLGSLLQQFQQSGHAEEANSWVGTGANKDISEQGLAESLGEDDINSLSQQTGMSRGDLLSALRRELPGIVDQLTPQGRVPAPHEMSQAWAQRRKSKKTSASLFLLLHGHCDVRVCRKPDFLTFHFRDEICSNVVMVAFVSTFAAVLLCQLDPLPLYFIDRTDAHTVCADDFHVLFDFAEISHASLLLWDENTPPRD